jgi:hypothetical protein
VLASAGPSGASRSSAKRPCSSTADRLEAHTSGGQVAITRLQTRATDERPLMVTSDAWRLCCSGAAFYRPFPFDNKRRSASPHSRSLEE